MAGRGRAQGLELDLGGIVLVPLLACLMLGSTAVPGVYAMGSDLSRPDLSGAPTKVWVGLYIADIFEISASDQTFLADAIVTAEWLDPRLAGRWAGLRGADLDEVWQPRLQVVNQRAISALLPQRVEIYPSGRVRYQQRWLGRFSVHLDLRDFPLDRQRCRVQLVTLGYSPDEVELIVNSRRVQSGRAGKLSVTDQNVGPARMEKAGFQPVPGARTLAGCRLQWDARRHMGYYAVEVIMPLVLIVLMGWTAFWVDPSVVTSRVSVAMTTMLTLVAYRFALARMVPTLAYLTRFDYFMLASTALVFVTVVLVAVGAYLVRKGRSAVVDRMDAWARLAFPVAFGAVLFVVWIR